MMLMLAVLCLLAFALAARQNEGATLLRTFLTREHVWPYRHKMITAACAPPWGDFPGGCRHRAIVTEEACGLIPCQIAAWYETGVEEAFVFRDRNWPHRHRLALPVKSNECGHPCDYLDLSGPPCPSKTSFALLWRGDFTRGSRRTTPPEENPRRAARGMFLLSLSSTPYGGGQHIDGTMNSKCLKDVWNANRYRWMLLSPLGTEIGSFLWQEMGTYRINSWKQVHPFRWTGANIPVCVEEGLLGCVAYSGSNPRSGLVAQYCPNANICPTVDPQALAAFENVWRRFEGRTATVRYVWNDDPQQRGWWVEYTAYVTAWLVMDSFFAAPDFYDFRKARFNLWYEGRVVAKWNGDLDDADYRAWIESFYSRYGCIFRPRHSHPCDPFVQCAQRRNLITGEVEPLTDAMGDTVFPPPGAQIGNEGCSGPAVAAGLGYSYWYMHEQTLCSYPGWEDEQITPACPLIHETTRRMLDRYGQPTEDYRHGWAVVQFSDFIPQLAAVPPLTVEYQVQSSDLDAYFDAETFTAHWTEDEIRIGSTSNFEMSGFLAFSMPDIPRGAFISNASLRFDVNATNAAGFRLEIYVLDTAQPGPFDDPFVLYNPAVMPTYYRVFVTWDSAGVRAYNVTQLVRRFTLREDYDPVKSRIGFYIRAVGLPRGEQIAFRSSEGEQALLGIGPRLRIQYAVL